jgi:hypothetical protein
MGILTSLGGAANRWGDAAGAFTRPKAAAGEGASNLGSGEQSRTRGQGKLGTALRRRGRGAWRGLARALRKGSAAIREYRLRSWRMISVGGQDGGAAQGAAPADGTPGRGGLRSAGGQGFWVLGGKSRSCRGGHDGQELAAAGQFIVAGWIG